MLKNIKSIYFSKILFSFLDDGVKLNLLRYNKNLQIKLDINIMNYKRFANKYIINEDNVIKEYNIYTDKLLYEGEYLNGKRWNEKGYDFNKNLSYELKNGKGYIIDFNNNEKLIFEGELINGEKNGK